MDQAARHKLLLGAVPVIEDDAYAELRFDGKITEPLLTVAREQVWHVGTFSKSLCPGLRVGWLIPPPSHRSRALAIKHESDLQANSLAQSILEQFLERAEMERRLSQARSFYRRRAERLARAIRRHLPAWRFSFPQGGFSIWVETEEPGDDTAFLEIAVAHGVSFDAGRSFRPDGAGMPMAVRLCYSAVGDEQLDEGGRRLALAWDEYRRSRDRSQLAVCVMGAR